jgi:hypothetical protein
MGTFDELRGCKCLIPIEQLSEDVACGGVTGLMCRWRGCLTAGAVLEGAGQSVQDTLRHRCRCASDWQASRADNPPVATFWEC